MSGLSSARNQRPVPDHGADCVNGGAGGRGGARVGARIGPAWLAALGLLAAFPQTWAPQALAQAVGQQTQPNVRFSEPVPSRQTPSDPVESVKALPNAISDGVTIPSADGQFLLDRFVLDGVTVFPEGVLDALYAQFVGQRVGLSVIQDVAEAIQTRYRQEGYFLARVRIPAQRITGTSVRLIVEEGYIGQVDVDGQSIPGHQKALDYLRQVTEERPLRFATLERALLLANDVPGLAVSVVLREADLPGGGLALLAQIRRRTARAFVAVDNFGSVFTGRLQGSGGYASQARTSVGERISVAVVGAGPFEPADAYVGQVTGGMAIGDHGLRIKGTLSVGRSEVGAFLLPANLQSDTILGLAEVSYPIIRRRDLSLEGRAGLEFVNTTTTGVGAPAGGLRDRSRVFLLRGLLTWADSRRGLNEFDLSVRTALPVLGATQRTDFSTRPGAGGSYVVVVAEATRVQQLTERFFVVGTAGGQIASNNVLASEEFTAGGTRFGRGFNQAQISGDRGVGAGIEVQFRDAVPAVDLIDAYQLFAFADYGRARNQFTNTGATITSVGLGMRTVIDGSVLGEVLLAKPVGGRNTVRDGDDPVGDLDPQILFRVSNTF